MQFLQAMRIIQAMICIYPETTSQLPRNYLESISQLPGKHLATTRKAPSSFLESITQLPGKHSVAN